MFSLKVWFTFLRRGEVEPFVFPEWRKFEKKLAVIRHLKFLIYHRYLLQSISFEAFIVKFVQRLPMRSGSSLHKAGFEP